MVYRNMLFVIMVVYLTNPVTTANTTLATPPPAPVTTTPPVSKKYVLRAFGNCPFTMTKPWWSLHWDIFEVNINGTGNTGCKLRFYTNAPRSICIRRRWGPSQDNNNGAITYMEGKTVSLTGYRSFLSPSSSVIIDPQGKQLNVYVKLPKPSACQKVIDLQAGSAGNVTAKGRYRRMDCEYWFKAPTGKNVTLRLFEEPAEQCVSSHYTCEDCYGWRSWRLRWTLFCQCCRRSTYRSENGENALHSSSLYSADEDFADNDDFADDDSADEPLQREFKERHGGGWSYRKNVALISTRNISLADDSTRTIPLYVGASNYTQSPTSQTFVSEGRYALVLVSSRGQARRGIMIEYKVAA